MVFSLRVDCETPGDMQSEAPFRIDVNEAVSEVAVLWFVVQRHPLIFSIGHVEVVV